MRARPYNDARVVIADPCEISRQTKVPRLCLGLKFALASWPAIGSKKPDYSWCDDDPALRHRAVEDAAKHNEQMKADSIARRFARAKRLRLL